MNQLKDWQSGQNIVIFYNIPETDFANSNDTTAALLSNFTQLIADVCEVAYHKQGVTSARRLRKKQKIIQEFHQFSLNFQTLK